MFIGHYSASFLAKSIDPRVPLWQLFIGAQFVDIIWGSLILIGIEKVRIVPGLTATNPLDLYYMPYTHSLVAVILWSLLVFGIYKTFNWLRSTKAAILISLTIFSHWFLDLLMHRPDLALYGDAHKVGLGLWQYPILTFVIEIGLLIGAILLWISSIKPITARAILAISLFALLLTILQLANTFGPFPPDETVLVISALASYLILAWLAGWLERKYLPLNNFPNSH